MSAPAFWDDQANARKVGSESNRLKQTVSRIEDFRSEVEDLEALCELCEEDEDDQDMSKEFVSTLENTLSRIDDLEVASFLNEPFDARPALLSAFMQELGELSRVIGRICSCGCMYDGRKDGL